MPQSRVNLRDRKAAQDKRIRAEEEERDEEKAASEEEEEAKKAEGEEDEEESAEDEKSAPDAEDEEESEAEDEEEEEEGAKGGSAFAERRRIKAITASEEATGRRDLADYLAFDTRLSAEEALAILAKAPKAQAGGGSLEQRMQAHGPRSIGDSGAPRGKSRAEQDIALFDKVTGLKRAS